MTASPFSVLVRLVVVATLAFGLADPASAARKKRAPSYEQLMESAEAEISAGRIETGLANFNSAAMADPTRKEPWVRSAQLQFDAGNYGRAIVAAEEVLKRDPADLVADSVVTVSGLRVAAESLKRLQGGGAIASESARREAEQLRATMISTMGNEFVTGVPAQKEKPKAKPKPRAKPRARSTAAAAPAAAPAPTPAAPASAPVRSTSGSNPFD
ncbi:hypothetical protein [Cognatilysobacter bugurensis]|uniref:Tetratricopeptide repeat protein n=1 Tax=Cognatilysobacter bugurensis TaxID=543356 RepID=A0A918W7N1_9GAMM|nr:hypothetical protein [Lysobacter bugurensis]GHA82263.1 hypothetical protein GCM10007067_20260 [Lysobacter bugurensis]